MRLHPEAVAEATASYVWYLEKSERAASRFRSELRSTLRLIAEFPSAWPPYEEETCKCKGRAFPFLVIYREFADSVQVIAVAHTSRRPGYWKWR